MDRPVVIDRDIILLTAMFVMAIGIVYLVFAIVTKDPFRVAIGVLHLGLAVYLFIVSDKFKIDKNGKPFNDLCE